MAKIPVGRTIVRSYGFLIHNIGAVIEVTWVPAVLSSAAQYFLRSYEIAYRADLQANAVGAVGPYVFLSFLSLVVVLLVSSVAAVGITRQALGQREGGSLFYFPLGTTERRMFAANIRYFLGALVLFILAAGISMVALLLAGFNPQEPPQVPRAALVLAFLVAVAVFAYAAIAALRIGLFLPPVVVEEAKGLRRSNELTKGNFWRALAVMVAVAAPIVLLAVAGEFAIAGAALGADFTQPQTFDVFMQQVNQAMDREILPWQVFMALLFVLGCGLLYSASAFAYRELMPELPEGGTS